jgi:hypothetical protein
MRQALVALFAILFLTGCVSYSGATLRSVADRNLSQTEVTKEMCADFALASQASMHGDDKAWPLLGKATEMRKLSVGLSKHSIQCFSTVERINRPERPLSDFHHGGILQSFKQSWGNVKQLAGEAK